MKLTANQIASLEELSNWSRNNSRFHWKPKTMEKFCTLGLAWKVNDERGGYLITEAGRTALKAMEGGDG
jgi:hypothetical protein